MLRPEDRSADSSGHLVLVQDGAWAFIPGELPPKLRVDAKLLKQLEEAAQELGRLGGVGGQLANPHLLIRPFVSREAVLSSKIEGSQATLTDLLLFEALPAQGSHDTREVSNYIAALEHGLEKSKARPVSLNLLLQMHGILMADSTAASAGQFRRIQNWIGPPGSKITGATYIPPPLPQMHEALDRLEKFIHAESELPLLVRLAIVHYQFEAIHPFIDGNGRLGRLLLALLLCTENVLPHPLLYLSEFFERHRRRYYELLLAVTRDGAWNEWLEFFLTGVAHQARDASPRAAKLQALRKRLYDQLQAKRLPAALFKLIDELFVSPYLTHGRAQEILEMTPRGASLNVEKLVKAGVLHRVPKKTRPALFVARQILEAISAPASA